MDKSKLEVRKASSLIGEWPIDLILLFNRIGQYCEENKVGAEECECMFNMGIVSRNHWKPNG
jgi:hypothetical protein